LEEKEDYCFIQSNAAFFVSIYLMRRKTIPKRMSKEKYFLNFSAHTRQRIN